MSKLIKWLKRQKDKLKNYSLYSHCYNQMEDEGIAVFGCCCGLSGGDKASGYLQYGCISCPYLVLGCEPYKSET